MTVRPARPDDVPAILAMVGELAEYERAGHEVRATEGELHAALFGDRPALFGHVAERDGKVVGFALWFLTFSTWLGRHGIYLEDLYVRPLARGDGHGKALLAALARICVDRGYGRLEWSVLDWNCPALDFYRSLGAVPMDEWTVQRLTGDALVRLTAGAAGGTAGGAAGGTAGGAAGGSAGGS
jgi:GNAT superfamily N-acetyltransferase